MQTLCGLFGKSRQAWYDEQKREDNAGLQAGLLLDEVRRLRLDLPSVGVDVLHYQLTDFRQQHGIKIGRDKLADLLRESGLLIKKRSRQVKTTWSHHHYFKYSNLTIGKKVLAPNQLWVSDITYILVGRGFGYPSLITDAYSRKIVGWALDASLQAAGPITALKMALKTNKGRLDAALIHHSDRGVQYCSGAYLDRLRQAKITISMTESGDPNENALAERVFRTLKEEFDLWGFPTFSMAETAIKQAIVAYNSLRPHGSLGYKTPNQAHQGQGHQSLKWYPYKKVRYGNVQYQADYQPCSPL